MRTWRYLPLAVAVALAATLSLVTGSSQATTTSVDLGITGSTVAGFTGGQAGQELPVAFTMKNHSSTTSADVEFYFTVTNATAGIADYTCPAISNHLNIFPDTPACEPGVLRPGKSIGAAIMVTPKAGVRSVSVKACAYNLDNYADPVSSNNCKMVTIAIS
jgi:hypothetical protein